MSIIIYGFKDNLCLPFQGKGFRNVFDNAKDADFFVKQMCNKVQANQAEDHLYAMYRTDETVSFDAVVHFHNSEGDKLSERNDIEKIDIMEVKKIVDLEYQRHLRDVAAKKMQITHEVKNMSKEELDKYKDLLE